MSTFTDMVDLMSVIKNPFQGDYKRVLCLCHSGILRSATAAWVLSNPPYDYNTRCAGIGEHALIRLDDRLLHWAQEIVYMEPDMLMIINQFEQSKGKPMFCLDIPDDYAYRDDSLIALIKSRYCSYRRPGTKITKEDLK